MILQCISVSDIMKNNISSGNKLAGLSKDHINNKSTLNQVMQHGAMGQKDNIWANVDQDDRHIIVSLGDNELILLAGNHPLHYIPWNMHMILLCFVLLWFCNSRFMWYSYPYGSGLLHWHWGNHMIAPVPVKEPWTIWVELTNSIIPQNTVNHTLSG